MTDITCKIYNPNGTGQFFSCYGYCAKHSTSGEAYEDMTTKPSKKIQSTGLSACCKGETKVVGGDVGEGTMFYQCLSCGKDCDMWSSTPKETSKKIKFKKLDIRLQHHFICHECTMKQVHTVIFFNNDDNVCTYCGSKNTEHLLQARLKSELMDYEGREEQIKRRGV